MRCLVLLLSALALTLADEDPNVYLNFVSEEIDSSEFGTVAGPRKTNCSCGLSNKESVRIVGGKEAAENEFPLMAGLANRDQGFIYCGASVITSLHVLTAAHCTSMEKGNLLSVILGEHDVMTTSGVTWVYNVKSVIEHEMYNKPDQQNDIALLVLEQEIKFDKFIGPACLPNKKLDLLNKYVTVIGWGKVRAKGRSSRTLRKVHLKVIPVKACALTLLAEIPTENPHQLCTYGHMKDACKGDSGGPVLWVDPETNRYTQVGIVSFGAGCGSSTPAINTDVSFFLDWIHRKIQETDPRGSTCSKV